MNKYISILFMFVSLALSAYGQADRNVVYKVATGDFAYTIGEKKNPVGNVPRSHILGAYRQNLFR